MTIKLNNTDITFRLHSKNIMSGYVPVKRRYEMMSHLIREVDVGSRFHCEISYATLFGDEVQILKSLLQQQRQTGELLAEVTTWDGTYEGPVHMTLNSDQTHFSYDEIHNQYLFENWKIILDGARLTEV